jgi:hypothetical protein
MDVRNSQLARVQVQLIVHIRHATYVPRDSCAQRPNLVLASRRVIGLTARDNLLISGVLSKALLPTLLMGV